MEAENEDITCIPEDKEVYENHIGVQNCDDLKKQAEYLFENKKIPVKIHVDLIQNINHPKEIKPVEKICQVCSSTDSLNEILVTNKGKMVSLFGVSHNIKVYMSECTACKMQYRHQE